MQKLVLGLDISTKTGWALLEKTADTVRYVDSGVITLDGKVTDYGRYPWDFCRVASIISESIYDLYLQWKPRTVAIEETNFGKSRYAQKLLEFIHHSVLIPLVATVDVVYLDSSTWRKHLGIRLSKDQKKNNARLSSAKQSGPVDKKLLGIRGKVTAKHLAIDYVNQKWGLDLKVSTQNDIADALCVAEAAALGAPICTGMK